MNYLRDQEVPLLLGGISFKDAVGETWDMSVDVDGFITWVNSLSFGGGGDSQEDQLDALVAAADMVPGGFIALAIDSRFHYDGDPWPPHVTDLTEAEVVSQLQGCEVYVDPTSAYSSYYTSLAVNGGIENNLGQYTFPLLRAAVMSQ